KRGIGGDFVSWIDAGIDRNIGDPNPRCRDARSQFSAPIERQSLAEIPNEACQPVLGFTVQIGRQSSFDDFAVYVLLIKALEAGSKVLLNRNRRPRTHVCILPRCFTHRRRVSALYS